jgi:hypothetical protein
MHILFILLRIKGLYVFRALLAHPQEAIHKLCLLRACYVSWLHQDCHLKIAAANRHNTQEIYHVPFEYHLLRMSK